ncbi:MAG: MMPL family transporter, partial [Alphaproteobacteria bacterium]|nr:MMPL family transporter [Alphaproteobacteria bacterium]
RPDALPFFQKNGLLFLSQDELASALDQIAQAQPLIGTLVSDPSLRGFFGTIGLMMQGAQTGAVDAATLARPLDAITETVNAALAGQDKPLDWQNLMPAQSPEMLLRQTRKFIITKPVLNFADLQPGEDATKAVRQAAQDLNLAPDNGVRVRLTGPVALNDQEFGSVASGTGLATALSGLLVLVLLFLAMRTWRIVLPIALTLTAGLVASTAFATVAVGSLNLISVAFAVMFIGIAVDFGIQFGVRYRDQHHREPDHARALTNTARVIAVPLAMAAGSTALGFLSFIPTDYRGVSELGLIAGAGMIIAFTLNITLLPALMTLTKPPAESESIGYKSLAPLNDFLRGNRGLLFPLIGLIVVGGLVLAAHIRFDFDPLDLKDPHTESVSTMFDIMQDPDSDAYAAQILAPSQDAAQDLADQLAKLPEVDHVQTLASFVPDDQTKKLAMIRDTASLLAPTFALPQNPAPTDAQNIEALRATAAALHGAGDKMASAQNLADALDKLAAAAPETRARAQTDIVAPLQAKMQEIRSVGAVQPVTLADIPPELTKDWVTAGGEYLVEIFPKRDASNNPRDLSILNRFIDAVVKIAPDVSGTPVSIRESGRTIVSAFVHAGIYGLVSISLLSLIVLRRPRDVVMMIAPLLVAGVLTLATLTVINLPLNFANIIALPLLLSLGVSYAVYFVFYAQTGARDLLQSSVARAVLFSAATVLTAFASLCLSPHTGTRGMGELLTIALLYSVACTFLLLPVLLGTRRNVKD